MQNYGLFNVRVFVRQTLIWFRVPGFIDAFGNVIYCKRQKALTYYQATICHFSIYQTLGFVRFPRVLKVKSFSFAPTCVYSPSRVDQIDVLIPETITTWVVQAVAVNNKTVLSFATLLRIVGFWDLFVSLKLPYSVGRGEQVSLLATELSITWRRFG